MLRSKIKHCQPNSHPFRAAFSGINSGRHPALDGTLFYFNFTDFVIADFERTDKIFGKLSRVYE